MHKYLILTVVLLLIIILICNIYKIHSQTQTIKELNFENEFLRKRIHNYKNDLNVVLGMAMYKKEEPLNAIISYIQGNVRNANNINAK